MDVSALKDDKNRLEKELPAAREHVPLLNDDLKVEDQETIEDLLSKLLKCHDYVCCDQDQTSVKLPDFVGGQVFVDSAAIPGRDPKKEFDVLSILAKIVTIGMVDVIYHLHRERISLDGKFSFKNFYWLSNKKIKLGREVRGRARLISKDRVNRDYGALPEAIKRIYELAVLKGNFRHDFQDLLDLMASEDPASKEVLIRYHFFLMDEISKQNHYLTIDARLEQLIAEDAIKWFKAADQAKSHKSCIGEETPDEDVVYNSDIVLAYITTSETYWINDLYTNKFLTKVNERHGWDKGFGLNLKPGSVKSRKELLGI